MAASPDLPVSKAFLSTRTSIAWLPDPPSEPTETLVLTGSTWYIDLRVSKEAGRPLYWGMAGVKEIVGGSKDKPRARFTNHLDSQQPELDLAGGGGGSAEDAPLPDEGNFVLLPTGQTLESGSMLNPATGRVQPYEEVWSGVDVLPGEPVLILVRRSPSVTTDGRPTAFLGIIGRYALALWQDSCSRLFGAWKAERAAADGVTWTETWSQQSSDAQAAGVAMPEGDAWQAALGPDETGSWKREGDCISWAGDEWEILERRTMGRGRAESA